MQFQPVMSAQNGPLPLSATFNAESDLTMILFVSGSAWAKQGGTWVGFQVLLDNASTGAVAAVYCNEPNSHRALIPTLCPIKVDFGQHTISLSPLAGTETDENDYFNILLIF
jgi:hypothetical protein